MYLVIKTNKQNQRQTTINKNKDEKKKTKKRGFKELFF